MTSVHRTHERRLPQRLRAQSSGGSRCSGTSTRGHPNEPGHAECMIVAAGVRPPAAVHRGAGRQAGQEPGPLRPPAHGPGATTRSRGVELGAPRSTTSANHYGPASAGWSSPTRRATSSASCAATRSARPAPCSRRAEPEHGRTGSWPTRRAKAESSWDSPGVDDGLEDLLTERLVNHNKTAQRWSASGSSPTTCAPIPSLPTSWEKTGSCWPGAPARGTRLALAHGRPDVGRPWLQAAASGGAACVGRGAGPGAGCRWAKLNTFDLQAPAFYSGAARGVRREVTIRQVTSTT